MTTTTDPTFRTAAEADIPALVALVESAYRGEASRTGWTTEADLLDGRRTDAAGVREVLGDPGGRLIVAELNGDLVACCHVARRDGPRPGESAAYFGMFAVRPVLQGAGLGRRVLAEAERLARAEWDAREMRMLVISARADLIAWYGRRGYTRTGRTSPFPYGDERFGIPRRPDLEFELLVKPLS
ncbi:GNAT family N-acetyltransferase [Streptomyces sp. NBC_01803]|uniref:GNAT family N-acetyltransferase n=1 Tax=Streptomyces sp. NBC_01803 TaxID=2975946 RepID=UPI002DDB5E2B|nr:GNAT family N-acetyltransferase [Streptomyces sp. NBC_01803]WSA42856.1 GNAT family N-acetyltransferase [Streptomyces sp. NBC_01803]